MRKRNDTLTEDAILLLFLLLPAVAMLELVLGVVAGRGVDVTLMLPVAKQDTKKKCCETN